MLNAAELTRRRNRVLVAIDELPVVDSLAVLSAAMRELAEQAATDRPEAANDGGPSSLDLLLEGDGSRLKVERDPEIRDFIHALRGPMTIRQITEACHQRFGERAPGRSSIHRYIQTLKYRCGAGGQGHA